MQDAAHRGSFFAARTWRNGIRSAIAQVVAKHEGIALGDLPDRVIEWWGSPGCEPLRVRRGTLHQRVHRAGSVVVAGFRGLAQERQTSLRIEPALPRAAAVRWDALGELTFGAAIGRTLERTHAAAVGVDREALERASRKALLRIREEFGDLRGIDDLCARSLLLGILRRMKDRGAVASPMFDGYLRSGGNPFAIRDLALQDFGPRSSLPVFPAPAAERDGVEALFGSRRSWYESWAEKVLTAVHILAARRDAADVLLVVMNALFDEGLVARLPAKNTKVWALNPARFHVTIDTAVLQCAMSSRTLVVSAREADLWHGVPCLDLAAQDQYVKHDPGGPHLGGAFVPAGGNPPNRVGRAHRAGVPARPRSSPGAVRRSRRQTLGSRTCCPPRRPWSLAWTSATSPRWSCAPSPRRR